MNAPASQSTSAPDGLYFYLSRAQADRDPQHDDPDYWVNRVFQDLCAAVERDRRAQPRWRAGYLDPCAGPDADFDPQTCEALALAEVFVAFYSLQYLNDVRPMAQRTQFQARFLPGEPDLGQPHVLPVLWEPTAEPDQVPEFKDAIELVGDLRGYADLGLFGLNRVRSYQDSYDRLLRLLSRWIVDVAEGSPAGRAHMPSNGQSGQTPTLGAFVVAVLAPSRGQLPHGRRGDLYGPQAVHWRPFGPTQPMPVARHTAVRSPRQQAVHVVDYDPDTDQFIDSPGLLLVDPWILELPNGRLRLLQALDRLPPWALPVVLADHNDAQYYDKGAQLVDDATDLCNMLRRPANQRRDVRDVETFDTIIPHWVHLAYRRFRDRPRPRPTTGFGRRPRLGDTSIDEEVSTGDD